MWCQSSCWLSSIVGLVFVVEAIVVLKKKSGGLRRVLGSYIHNGALVKFIKHNKKTYQKLKTHMRLEPSPCPQLHHFLLVILFGANYNKFQVIFLLIFLTILQSDFQSRNSKQNN